MIKWLKNLFNRKCNHDMVLVDAMSYEDGKGGFTVIRTFKCTKCEIEWIIGEDD